MERKFSVDGLHRSGHMTRNADGPWEMGVAQANSQKGNRNLDPITTRTEFYHKLNELRCRFFLSASKNAHSLANSCISDTENLRGDLANVWLDS